MQYAMHNKQRFVLYLRWDSLNIHLKVILCNLIQRENSRDRPFNFLNRLEVLESNETSTSRVLLTTTGVTTFLL